MKTVEDTVDDGEEKLSTEVEDNKEKDLDTKAEEDVEKDSTKEEAENETQESSLEKKKSKGIKLRNFFIELSIYVVIIVLCVVFVPKYVVQRTIVDGSSMNNTLYDEENLLVEKVSYHFQDPKRFDVICFYPYGKKDGSYYIKRVIGLPGETIQIKGDTVYINGKELKEDYGKDPMTDSGIAAKPLKLGSDEFFVLGDNRQISEDSRFDVGPVSRKNIVGKAFLRIFPLSKFGDFDK